MFPNPFKNKMLHNFYSDRKLRKKVGLLQLFSKAAQIKQLPKWAKFAQSGTDIMIF
jgi:hypothetical protein